MAGMTRRTKTQMFLLTLARRLVSAAVVLSPWMFGSAEGWAYLLICILSGWGVAAWLLAAAFSGSTSLRAPGTALLLGILTLFIVAQLVPLPEPLVRALNPAVADMQAQTQSLFNALNMDSILQAGPLESTLSASPLSTRRALFLWFAYAGTFLVLAGTIQDWFHLRRLCLILVFSGFIMALVSIVHKFSGSGEILWFHVPRYGGNIFGPFSNRNHFAAHMNMLFGVALGLALSSPGLRNLALYRDWRDRIEWLSSRSASSTALSMFAVVILGSAVGLSLSRGAMLSLAVSLGFLGAIIAWRQRTTPGARTRIALLTALIVATILWTGSDQVIERLGTLREVVRNPLEDFRSIITRDTLTAFSVSPFVGWGFGAYRHVLPQFQRPDMSFRWLHAHNDWAELLADGGLIGALLFLLTLRFWVAYIYRRFPHASGTVRQMLVGLLFGLCTIGLHSLVDYSLHKPGNAMLLAALAGMVAAGVHLRRSDRASSPPPAFMNPPAYHPATVRLTALALLMGTVFLHGALWRDLRGELAFTRFTYLERLAQRTTNPVDLDRVIDNAATEAELVASGGYDPDTLDDVTRILVNWSLNQNLPRTTRATLASRAERVAAYAVRGAPSNYIPWLELARVQLVIGQWDRGELCLQRARQLTNHPDQIRMFAPIPKEDEG